nr:glycosyltransferase [Sulfobacillus harzensis]
MPSTTYQRFQRVVATSRWRLRQLVQEGLVLPSRIQLVDAPSLPAATTSEPAPQSEGLTVAVLGPMTAVKGVDLAINALAELSRQTPGWRLWLMGDGPDRARFQAYAQAMDVQTTWHPSDAWELALRAADVLLAPQFQDSLGWDAMWAQRLGTPVVAGNLPVMEEQLGDWPGARLLSRLTVMEVIEALDSRFFTAATPSSRREVNPWREAFSF